MRPETRPKHTLSCIAFRIACNVAVAHQLNLVRTKSPGMDLSREWESDVPAATRATGARPIAAANRRHAEKFIALPQSRIGSRPRT